MKENLMNMTDEQKNVFKNIRKTNRIIAYISLMLIIITISYVLLCFPNTKELNNIKLYKEKQDSLQQLISHYEKSDKLYSKKIIELSDSVAYLNALLEYNEQEINSLKKRRNAKNINISKYSTTDIKKFWSDRYKDSLQSK